MPLARRRVRLFASFALEHRWCRSTTGSEREPRRSRIPSTRGGALEDGHAKAEIVFAALERLQPRLAEAGVPGAEGRLQLFLELIHPSNAAERAIHAVQ